MPPDQIFRFIFAIGCVFVGCCLNLITLELIVKADPGCGTLLTFCQFSFISMLGIYYQLERKNSFPFIKLKDTVVPRKNYLLMVFLFTISSTLNNLAFNFKISVPLHTIFRSSSMVSTAFLSWLIYSTKYTFRQLLSIFMVTIGLVVVTLASIKSPSENHTEFYTELIGIFILITALLCATSLGIYQDYCKSKFGSAPAENSFYSVITFFYDFFILPFVNIFFWISAFHGFTFVHFPLSRFGKYFSQLEFVTI